MSRRCLAGVIFFFIFLLSLACGRTAAYGGPGPSYSAAPFSSAALNCSASFMQDCRNCSRAINSSCVWCAATKACQRLNTTTAAASAACPTGWCQGEACRCEAKKKEDCVNGIFPCSRTVEGLLLLMAIYGVILAFGAKLISNGSELLLEILDPGIIGGLVIPVLGALPDTAIVVVSGALGSADDAQKKLAVGVGTLAGSTIMLLTLPWAASLVLARTDIRHGESVDMILTRRRSLRHTGTTVDKDTCRGASIMIATSASYLIVQGVAFAYLQDPSGHSAKRLERWFALAGLITCCLSFVAYSVYQVLNPKLQQKRIENARDTLRMELALSVLSHNLIAARERRQIAEEDEANRPLLIEEGEAGGIAEQPSPSSRGARRSSPSIDRATVRNLGLKWKARARQLAIDRGHVQSTGKEKDEEEQEAAGEESPEPVNKRKIAIKAIIILLIGTGLVSFFSDPIVDVITDFGEKINIPPFFVSFIITPFCSNASELISSLIFAAKKRKKNSSLTYSALYGAATMNNTMCLGVFFALIFFRHLAWEFSAEVVSILFVTLVVGLIGTFRRTLQLFWVFPVVLLYPFSIFLVWILESQAHWK
ncbi:Sodium/calcium exchanger NCL2 [Balamuthia mandrillaris]